MLSSLLDMARHLKTLHNASKTLLSLSLYLTVVVVIPQCRTWFCFVSCVSSVFFYRWPHLDSISVLTTCVTSWESMTASWASTCLKISSALLWQRHTF
ncbi:hypothetical protein BDR07DRAFT_1333363 [Suillus spraguei]|nr:hypothetical protein BDR07DRAFT_1333363 [Suillus spraguei]